MTATRSGPRHKGSLFRRYTLYLVLLLSFGVLISGGIGAWFAYRDARALVEELQREKARSAATRIEQFLRAVELQLKGALVSTRALDVQARHFELIRLLRIAPSISEAASLDSAGHERVRVSRIDTDVLGSHIDRSAEPAVISLRAGQAVGYGGIGFRQQSEPHLSMAVSGNRPGDGLVIAGINLKFASDVVAGIRIGQRGTAYVVDSRGGLIVHSDSGLALRLSNLAHLPQVRAALEQPDASAAGQPATIASVDGGPRIISAHATIQPLGWRHGKGLGLGLAIVERLAGLLGLALHVNSVPGRGSVFAIDVPLAPAASDREMPLPQALAAARFEGLSVLLIDDDCVAREAMEGLLVQWGCDVRSVASGAAALQRLAGTPPPRLIICDYHLGADELGTAVVQQIRALAGAATPAVILSADVTQPLREATASAGLHLLHKPLNAARLRVLLMHIAAGPDSGAAPTQGAAGSDL